MMPYEVRREIVKEMWDKNFTGKEIGVKLGMTRNAVMGVVHRLIGKGELLHKTAEKQKVAYDRVMSERNAKSTSFNPPIKKFIKTQKAPYFRTHYPEEPSQPTNFMDLNAHSCKFSVSGERASEYIFCNEPATNKSYCNHHYLICYAKKETRPKQNYNQKAAKGNVFLNY
jgi:hypothetical protein